MPKNWFFIALINFLLAAGIGLLLRIAFVVEIPWLNFTHFLHAHSHIAMLGWVYLALYALFVHVFLPKEASSKPFYKKLFLATQATVVGMLFTFPFQGYAFGSILFSSLNVILSYWFAYRFNRDLPALSALSTRFIRYSLGFLILSTLALWVLAMVIKLHMQGTPLYFSTVQFYLHFQLNGWFIFALIGLFLRILEQKGIDLPEKTLNRFLTLLTVSCVLTYVLAITWSTPVPALFGVNSAGVTIQFIALIFFIRFIRGSYASIRSNFKGMTWYLMKTAFIAFVLKILVQTAVVIPYIARIGYTIRNYVIGFLHLLLLGMISHFLIGAAHQWGLMKLDSKVARTGIILLSAGFILSELLLIVQGTMFWGALGFLPGYYEALSMASALMPTGIALILWSYYRTRC